MCDGQQWCTASYLHPGVACSALQTNQLATTLKPEALPTWRPCHSPAGGCRRWLPVGSPLVTQINMTSAAVSAAATAAAVAAGAAAFACKKVDLAVSWT